MDTSNLVKFQSGNNQGKYDWSNNIGKELYFEYDDISGYIKILDYVKANRQGHITLKYKNNIMTTGTPNLIHLTIPSLFNKEKLSKHYKYNVGDIINKYNDSIKILELIRINYENSSCRGYKIECLDCHYIYETREDKISTCPICGKKSSYPERFIYSILKQAEISFMPQKDFEWLPNRFYDAYLPDNNSIIEIHGLIHYQPVKLNGRKSPEEIHEEKIISDKIKHVAALNNKMKYYIINASEPEKLFQTAKNVLNFLDFSNISELECEKFANYKKIRDVCNLWNQGFTLDEIHVQIKEPIQSIQQKLRFGHKYNMCNYSKKMNMHFHKIINPNRAS